MNYEYYRNLASREDKREKDRERISGKRSKINDVANSRGPSQKVANVAYTEAEAYTEEDIYIQAARKIFAMIRQINPKNREPKFSQWSMDVRLMVQRDHRTIEEVMQLFEWANNHPFWKTNILSPATLRKQWDKLVIQKQNPQQGRGGPKTFDDYHQDSLRRIRDAEAAEAAARNDGDYSDAIAGVAKRVD